MENRRPSNKRGADPPPTVYSSGLMGCKKRRIRKSGAGNHHLLDTVSYLKSKGVSDAPKTNPSPRKPARCKGDASVTPAFFAGVEESPVGAQPPGAGKRKSLANVQVAERQQELTGCESAYCVKCVPGGGAGLEKVQSLMGSSERLILPGLQHQRERAVR